MSVAGFGRKNTSLQLQISARLKDMDNMASYVKHIMGTAEKLRGTGFIIHEVWIVRSSAGIPDRFSPLLNIVAFTSKVIQIKRSYWIWRMIIS